MEEISSRENRLALFDFDGTLTRFDTMLAFVIFARGWFTFLLGMLILSPILILNKIGLLNSDYTKRTFLKFFFWGVDEEKLKKWGQIFCASMLPKLFRDLALEKLNFHRSKGHTVYVVTASVDIWVQPWLETQGLKGICTQMEFEDGKFKGKFVGPNCNGPEKVNRIRQILDLDYYEKIFAYGDSSGDKEMLAIAHKPYYRKFI